MGPSCAVAFGTVKDLRGVLPVTASCGGGRGPRRLRASWRRRAGAGLHFLPATPQPWASGALSLRPRSWFQTQGRAQAAVHPGGRGSRRQPWPQPRLPPLALRSPWLPRPRKRLLPSPARVPGQKMGRRSRGDACVTEGMAPTWVAARAASPVGASFAGPAFAFALGLGSWFVAFGLVSPRPRPRLRILRARLSSPHSALVMNKIVNTVLSDLQVGHPRDDDRHFVLFRGWLPSFGKGWGPRRAWVFFLLSVSTFPQSH